MKKYQPVLDQLFRVMDSYKPQPPGYYLYLTDVMKDHYFSKDTVLYEKGQVVRKAYFLASGFAMAYYYNDEGERQVVRIYEKNDVIAGKSFTDQTPSEEYLLACRDSYWLSLTYEEVTEIYALFPDTQEQSRLIVAARELKELERNRLLAQKGIELARQFYNRYPELLNAGKIMRESDIASYLLMSKSNLRLLRQQLLRDGL